MKNPIHDKRRVNVALHREYSYGTCVMCTLIANRRANWIKHDWICNYLAVRPTLVDWHQAMSYNYCGGRRREAGGRRQEAEGEMFKQSQQRIDEMSQLNCRCKNGGTHRFTSLQDILPRLHTGPLYPSVPLFFFLLINLSLPLKRKVRSILKLALLQISCLTFVLSPWTEEQKSRKIPSKIYHTQTQ